LQTSLLKGSKKKLFNHEILLISYFGFLAGV